MLEMSSIFMLDRKAEMVLLALDRPLRAGTVAVEVATTQRHHISKLVVAVALPMCVLTILRFMPVL